MARTRSDYRNEQPGSLRYYLIFEYPMGLDFRTRSFQEDSRLHDDRRDGKGNFESLAGGRPDMSQAFVDSLEAVPRRVFEQALKEVEGMRGLSSPGTTLVSCLAFYQHSMVNRAKEYTRAQLALELGITERQVGRCRDTCIDLVAALVFTRGTGLVWAG